jgi:DNA repair exonuclease SbcCD nuclease subunit
MNNSTYKMLVIGDIHIKRKDLSRSSQLLEALSDSINSLKPDMAVMLGDVFDNHATCYAECQELFCDFLDKTRGTVKVHLCGNHEMENGVELFPKTNSLSVFTRHYQTLSPQYYNELPSYIPVVKPSLLDIGVCSVGFVPYAPPGMFREAFNKLGAVPDLILCHQEFHGASYVKGTLSERGDAIEPWMNVIAGHLHNSQTLEKDGGRIWYPGTPIQHDFSDRDDKAIYLIEVSAGGKYTIKETIRFSHLPQFRTVRLSASEVAGFKPTGMAGDKLRFVISGTKAELLSLRYDENYRTLASLGKIKPEVVKDQTPTPEKTEQVEFEKLLKTYCANEGVEDAYNLVFE